MLPVPLMHQQTTSHLAVVRRHMMFARVIAGSLLFGTLTLFGDAPDSAGLPQRAHDFVAAFQAGQLEQLMKLWSPAAQAAPAGRRRLTILIEERSTLDLSISDVLEEGARGLVKIELHRNRTPSISLGRYTLEFKREDGQWRIWTITSSEAEGARQLLEASPEERDRLMKTSPPTVALTRELLLSAIEYLDAGEIEKSVPVLGLAADLAERTGDGVTRASAERTLGRLAIVRGDSAAAAERFENSLRLSESSGDRRGVARSLTNLANIDRMKGNYQRAESRWRTALDIYVQDSDKPGQANVLNNLGTLRTSQGDYPDAAKKLEEALTIFRELNDTAGQARAMNNLGIVLRSQGAYREALEHYQKALQLNREAENLEGVANALGNSGNLYMTLGNYVKALEAFQEGLAIGERLKYGQAMALGLSGIGEVYLSVGDYPQALEYLEKSYAVAEQRGNKQVTAFLLHEIGMVRALQGDLPRALEYYQRSLTKQTEMGNRAEVAINLKDIGKVDALLGKQNEARTSLEKSLEIAQQINDRLTMVEVLVDLAELAKRPEEYEWGLDFARRAMKITAEIGLADEIWGVHLELGRFYRRMNRPDEARAEIESAIAIVERVRRGIPGEEMAQSAFESMVLPYHEMIGMLVARGDFATAFEYTERAKGRVLLDVMHQGRSDVSRAMTDAERAREKELVARLVQLNRDLQRELTSAGSKTDRAPDLRTRLGPARLEYEAFLTGLYVVHPQLRIERGEMIPIRATELRSLLAQRAADAFLEFVVTEEATYLFAVSGNGTPGGIDLRVHTIAMTRKELEDEVRRFRESLAGRELTYAPAARALFDKLLRPAEDQLRDAKQVCIIPDGPLWELPFQALQPVHGRFLLDRQAIFYAPSITVLRETLARKKGNAHPARSGELLAFGNPVVPSEVASGVHAVYRDASVGPLPEAETEVRQIASLYDPKESRVYVRKDAREEVVKTEAARFRVLHFATHGILDDQSPLIRVCCSQNPTTQARTECSKRARS
ncbi:MAG TPA: CHAT domain-containing tetratricopeptide repeat protein [Thermoanaerobaculia bacterium]